MPNQDNVKMVENSFDIVLNHLEARALWDITTNCDNQDALKFCWIGILTERGLPYDPDIKIESLGHLTYRITHPIEWIISKIK